jgi:hypothetical protein
VNSRPGIDMTARGMALAFALGLFLWGGILFALGVLSGCSATAENTAFGTFRVDAPQILPRKTTITRKAVGADVTDSTVCEGAVCTPPR